MIIVDYGMGNLGSILNMIKKLGGKPTLTSDPAVVAVAEKLVLPGVGAFDHGISGLHERGLSKALTVAVERGSAVLGICLGMQLMLDASEEGRLPGLGWIPGRARRFPEQQGGLKVPHMGWNVVTPCKENPLLRATPEEPARFYFVHSYKVECDEPGDVLAVTDYGDRFCSAFQRGKIFGVQFHPEKSHVFGMALFRNFLEL